MTYKLGITGMDPTSESALRAALTQALPRLGGRWVLAAEAEADHVIIDMDSMYGPMSWIRLHAAGKQVIGLTTSPQTQADHRLQRPFDSGDLVALLDAIAVDAPLPAPDPAAAQTLEPEAPPSMATPAPAPADQLPEEQPAPADAEAAAPPGPAAVVEPESTSGPMEADDDVPEAGIEPAPEPAPDRTPETPPLEMATEASAVTAADETGEPESAIPAPEPVSEQEPELEPELEPEPEREPTLTDWLAPGALSGRWRYRFAGGSLAFDADAGTYLGPATLKPLAAAFQGTVGKDALEPLDDAAWAEANAGAGEAQPLSRLQWFGALLAGKGALLPGHDPDGQYRLMKWPRTEREYPRHFRIATAMMKGPASVAEVAAASGVGQAEVADFVNANLATGYAEFVPPAPPEPEPPEKPSGLFGRLRGR